MPHVLVVDTHHCIPNVSQAQELTVYNTLLIQTIRSAKVIILNPNSYCIAKERMGDDAKVVVTPK